MTNDRSLPQLVVIGSSAGGIEALSTLVSTLATPFPAPCVIAQHLDPSRPSHLGEILARRSTVPVVTVQEHEQLLSGTVYVVPANHHVEVTDHDITLHPHKEGRPKPSIDLLLSSASEVYGERLIAVILTGTGSDGALGCRAVKAAGGTVLIENPDTAAYPGMPQSVEHQIVDIVADLPRIGPILYDLLTGVAIPTQDDARSKLEPFLDRVREHTGIDFHSYKTPTILRRLQRCIIAAGAADLDQYTEFLEHHPDEYQRLASSFLIKVTDFMRDPELFQVLREKVLPDLIASGRDRSNELRFWSAGCATGEEAYSLAILVLEALGDELPNFTVKIFATDLDSDAIAFARRGLYPSSALVQLPDDLIDRYFTKTGKGYEVKKLVRSLVVFGEHDLGQRAPFPRIDMVLCRNVLIYFTRELQQRALQLFAFSLREGGYLALGKTETVSPAPTFFAPELPKLKVYRRHGKERPTPPFHIQGHTLPSIPSTTSVRRPDYRFQRGSRQQGGHVRTVGTEVARELFIARQESLQARMSKETLLLNLPVGVVVVDRRYDIQEINSAARRLLGIHTVAIGEDLLHLAPNVPNKAFRAAIDKAFREGTVSKLSEVQVPQMTTGEPAYLQIECYPRPDGRNDDHNDNDRDRDDTGGKEGKDRVGESVLILVLDVTEMVQSRREVEQGAALLGAQAEELRVANAALAANNEEIRRTNVALEEAHRKAEEAAARHAQQIEALVADEQEVVARHAQQIEVLADANRGLLTANQEVTRANSELRSRLDDFLVTNEESQAAIEEVETLNEEMQATNEELETLNEELQATVEELNTSNADLAARGDELQSLASSLEVQKAQLEAILSGLADAVLVVTPQGKPLLMNEAYKRLFGIGEAAQKGDGDAHAEANSALNNDAANKEGDPLNYIADGDGRQVRMEDENLRPLLSVETPQARAARGQTFRMTFSLASLLGGDRRWLEAIGQPVHGEGGQEWGVVVVRDITEHSLRIMQEQFTQLAGHELRTPLTAIKGYLQLLDRSLKEHGSERQRNHVQVAITQCERLMRLIEDLLDVARLQSGKFSLRQEPVRLDTLLEQAVASAQVLTKEQKIELIIDGGAAADSTSALAKDGDGVGDDDAANVGGPLLVNGDAARIEQAVLNLLTNAITYAPDSARIEVRLGRVDGKAADGIPAAAAEIDVQDYGNGIAAKDLSEVFTRFYQVRKGNPLPAQGLGLGLFITKQIVEAHGGTISVASTEGKGATFTIRLPILGVSAHRAYSRTTTGTDARTGATDYPRTLPR